MSLPLLNQRPKEAVPTCCQFCGRNPVLWDRGKPSRFVYFFEDAHSEYRYACRRCYVLCTLGRCPVQLGVPDGIDQIVLTACANQVALMERFRRESVDVRLPDDGGVVPFRPPTA